MLAAAAEIEVFNSESRIVVKSNAFGLPESGESHSNPAMNYLAHGFRFLDSPLMVAGTAVPDWLSVVDRRVRIRSRRIHEHFDSLSPDLRAIAEGMLQHLHDGDLFHRSVRSILL